MEIWGIIVAVSIVAAIYACIFAVNYAWQISLKRARKGATFQTFLRYFANEQHSERVCFTVYRYLQGLLAIRDFPVLPTDDLDKPYGIGGYGGVGFDEVIEDISEKLGIKVPTKDEFYSVATEIGSVNRVEDLVRLFFRLSEKSPTRT